MGEFPNKGTQFSSENQPDKNGRTKGSRNLSTILNEMLEEDATITNEKGEKEKKKFADIIVRKLIKKANDGDIRAIQEIFDRTEGKSKQTIETKISTSTPLINWVTPPDDKPE